MRISDWSSDVCSSDLLPDPADLARRARDAEQLRIVGERIDPFADDIGGRNAGDRDFPAAKPGVELVARHAAALPQRDDAAEVAHRVGVVASTATRRVGKECARTCSSAWTPYH